MDPKGFMVIYPSYLDSTKTLKQGRRIGKEHAVDTPTVSDISQALQQLGLRHVLQPHKGYSRDAYTLWDNPGRVKVETSGSAVPKIMELDDDNDENIAPEGNAKRQLLLDIASRIPSLPSRIQRLEEEAAARKAAEEDQARQQKQLQQQKQQISATQKPQSAKKKGKKKR